MLLGESIFAAVFLIWLWHCILAATFFFGGNARYDEFLDQCKKSDRRESLLRRFLFLVCCDEADLNLGSTSEVDRGF